MPPPAQAAAAVGAPKELAHGGADGSISGRLLGERGKERRNAVTPEGLIARPADPPVLQLYSDDVAQHRAAKAVRLGHRRRRVEHRGSDAADRVDIDVADAA